MYGSLMTFGGAVHSNTTSGLPLGEQVIPECIGVKS